MIVAEYTVSAHPHAVRSTNLSVPEDRLPNIRHLLMEHASKYLFPYTGRSSLLDICLGSP